MKIKRMFLLASLVVPAAASTCAATDDGVRLMREAYQEAYRTVDASRAISRIEAVWRHEVGQTVPCKLKAAEQVVEFLKEDGFSDVTAHRFPTDGVTSYQDKRMPLAWDASVGRLTLIPGGEQEKANLNYGVREESNLVADFSAHPFHLVKGSTALPAGGVEVKILTEEQFLAGEDATDAFVMLGPDTAPRRKALVPILDRGARGFISDFLVGRFETPDAIQWVTACTETSSWSVDTETRPFVGFSVSPRTGARIRKLAANGMLRAKAECDGRRYATEVPFITATVPGKRPEEFWIIAHMYEPLTSDDSCGVVAAIETARRFIGPEKPEFTIRVLFGIELYGYAAWVGNDGKSFRDRVVGAVNLDSIPAQKNMFLKAFIPAPATPFYGGLLMEALGRALTGEKNALETWVPRYGEYFDDMFMTDPTVGVATGWLQQGYRGAKLWHNSTQDMSLLDAETYRQSLAFAAVYADLVANPKRTILPVVADLSATRVARAAKECKDADVFRHLAGVERRQLADFARAFGDGAMTDALKAIDAQTAEAAKALPAASRPATRWRRYAEGIVPARRLPGFTQDYVRIPRDKRWKDPVDVIYSAYGYVVANMDGRKNLAELIREAEGETGAELDEKTVKSYALFTCYLADWGYLDVRNANVIRRADVVRLLAEKGVKTGDTLIVRADVSELGHVEGGEETVLAALKDAVGENGTVLLPAFTPSVRMCGAVNNSWAYRPYDPKDFRQILPDCALAKAFLRANPSAKRSASCARSWTGFGARAAEFLGVQKEDSDPCGADSPRALALAAGAKEISLGVPEESAPKSFAPAVIGVRNADGTLRDVVIRNFPRQ